MDIVLSQHQWKRRHLIQINSVRRYLQAQTLADITNLQGTRILPHATSRPNQPLNNTTRISTFNQKLPQTQAWNTWRRFLRTISTSLFVLYQPLGDWTVELHKVRHWPKYAYDPTTDTLYSHHHEDHYFTHPRIAPGIFTLDYTTPPRRATGYPTAVVITMAHFRPIYNFSPPDPIHLQTWKICTYATQLSPWEYALLHHSLELQPNVLPHHLQRWIRSRRRWSIRLYNRHYSRPTSGKGKWYSAWCICQFIS